MPHRPLPLLALALLAPIALAAASAEASPIVIDGFDTAFLVTGIGSLDDAGGLGAMRHAQVFTSGDRLEATAGDLIVNDDSDNSTGVEALVSWIFGPADLTDGGSNNRFELDVTSALHGDWTAAITAYTSDQLFATVAKVVPGSSTTLSFLFSEFVDNQVPGVGPVDFASIDHLQLSLFSASSADDVLGVAELRAVPEPGTLALFLSGLLGLAAASPRRRLAL